MVFLGELTSVCTFQDPNFKVETGFLRDNDVEGNITLVTKLDYEQQNVYEIKIAAWVS